MSFLNEKYIQQFHNDEMVSVICYVFKCATHIFYKPGALLVLL